MQLEFRGQNLERYVTYSEQYYVGTAEFTLYNATESSTWVLFLQKKKTMPELLYPRE